MRKACFLDERPHEGCVCVIECYAGDSGNSFTSCIYKTIYSPCWLAGIMKVLKQQLLDSLSNSSR